MESKTRMEMDKYTDRNGLTVIGTHACGCKVIRHPDKKMNPFIKYCPMHATAPAMYEALKKLTEEGADLSRGIPNYIRQALAQAEGKA